MNKPQLHSSHLDTFWMCAHRFELRWMQGIIVPPNFVSAKRLATGTGTHGGVGADLNHVIEAGELLSLDQVQDAARDATNEAWARNGVQPLKEEKGLSEKIVRGEAVDQAIALSSLHHVELAPAIKPTAVERKWVLNTPDDWGWGYDLAGAIDVDEESRIIDLKTAGKKPGTTDAHDRDQFVMYSMAKLKLDGVLPIVEAQYLIKTKTPTYSIQSVTPNGTDHQILLRKIGVVIAHIRAGLFPPTSQANWWCSLENCGYAANHCQYYRRGK